MDHPDSETVFAKIIRREIPVEVVYEDEKTLAFLDAHPNHPGHTLVVPKQWSRDLLEMDADTLQAYIRTVQKVAIAVKTAMNADGINIDMNIGAAAGQAVFHTHFHIIPRYEGDGFKHFPQSEYKPGEMAEVAAKIRPLLK